MNGNFTCPKCGARIPDGAVLCGKCGANLAHARALRAEKSIPMDIHPSGAEFRRHPALIIFYSIVGLASLALGLFLIFEMTGRRSARTTGAIVFTIVALLLAIWMVYLIIRALRLRIVLSRSILTVGNLDIPLTNLRFIGITVLRQRTGPPTTSFSVYFRNSEHKGAILIPGTIRNREALVRELLPAILPTEETTFSLVARCPYCGAKQDKKAFSEARDCTECGKNLKEGIDALDEGMRYVYTANRVGFYIVSGMVLAAIGAYLAVAGVVWRNAGGLLYILLGLFMVFALGALWFNGLTVYSNEKTLIRLADVMRHEPNTEEG